ncbi:hypothetical protein KCP70_23860 [Salmonella enterica subsp. enterica]|nr:hypothetical protein KCP70_23860 [Salmonella enterica subsp. enterica]
MVTPKRCPRRLSKRFASPRRMQYLLPCYHQRFRSQSLYIRFPSPVIVNLPQMAVPSSHNPPHRTRPASVKAISLSTDSYWGAAPHSAIRSRCSNRATALESASTSLLG